MSFHYEHLSPALADNLIDAAGLGDIHAKIKEGVRLDYDDGVRLYETPALAALGLMANQVRREGGRGTRVPDARR